MADHEDRSKPAPDIANNNTRPCVICTVVWGTRVDGMCPKCLLQSQIARLQGDFDRVYGSSSTASTPLVPLTIDVTTKNPSSSTNSQQEGASTTDVSSLQLAGASPSAARRPTISQPPNSSPSRPYTSNQVAPMSSPFPVSTNTLQPTATTSFIASIIERHQPIVGAGSTSRNLGYQLVVEWGLAAAGIPNLSSLTNQYIFNYVPACVPKSFFTSDVRVLLEEDSLLRHKFNSVTMGHAMPGFIMARTLLKGHFNSLIRDNMRQALTESARNAAHFTGYIPITALCSQSDLDLDLKCYGRPKWIEFWTQIHADHCTNWCKGPTHNLDILTRLSMEAMGVEYRAHEKGLGCFKSAATKQYHNMCTFLRSYNKQYTGALGTKGSKSIASNLSQFPTRGSAVQTTSNAYHPRFEFPISAESHITPDDSECDSLVYYSSGSPGKRARMLSENAIRARTAGVSLSSTLVEPCLAVAPAHQISTHGAPAVTPPFVTTNGGVQNTEAPLPASPLISTTVDREPPAVVDREPTAVPVEAPLPASPLISISVDREPTAVVYIEPSTAVPVSSVKTNADGLDQHVGGEIPINDFEAIQLPAGLKVDGLLQGPALPMPPAKADTKVDGDISPSKNGRVQNTQAPLPASPLISTIVDRELSAAVPAVVVGSNLMSPEKPPIKPHDIKKVASRSKRGTTKLKLKASDQAAMVVTGNCPSPENHSWFREGPYTKEINGNYSSINGARCLGLLCQRQVVGIAQPGCEREGRLILPSKDFPVWVCCSCDSVLWCDTCFQGKAAAFNKINPGKLPRTRRQKIIDP